MGITGLPLTVIQIFLNNRLQRVVLNGQTFPWNPLLAGVPQGSILGPFFLIYINDLAKGISSTAKLFADDTSIFSVVNDINVSGDQMNKDLEKISMWAYHWKMSFSPDISKQAQEITFSKKNMNIFYSPFYFNKNHVVVCSYQKHLGVFLDKKLNFQHHIKEKIAKASKRIGVIKKLNNAYPRNALLTIYKSFIRLHLDCGDILYHQPNNESMNSKLENVQYITALAITGAIKGTSRSILYKELGLESLKSRRTFRRLCSFHKILSAGLPTYLFNLIPKSTHGCQNRTSGKYSHI